MLTITVSVKRMVTARAVRWYGHVLRREEGNILKETLNFKTIGRGKGGRPKASWKKQVETLIKDIDLRKENAPSGKRCRLGVKTVKGNVVNLATFVDGDKTG